MIEGQIEQQVYEHKLNEITEFANKSIFELKRQNLSESLKKVTTLDYSSFQPIQERLVQQPNPYVAGQQVQNSLGQGFTQYFHQMKSLQSEPSLLPFIKETFKEKIKRVDKACLDSRKQEERGKKTTEEQYKDLQDRYSEILQEHTLLERKEKVLDERLELCTDRIEKNKSLIDQRSLMIQRLELERQQIEQNLGDLSEIKAPLSDRSKGNRSARSNNNRSHLYKEDDQKQLTDNSEFRRHRRKDSEDFSELPSMIQEESQAPQQTERMAHLEKLEKGKVSYMLKRMKEVEKEKQKRKRQGRSRNETDSEDEGATKKDPAIKFIKKIIDRKK
ncbi:hypothetical protein FGO68_gene7647 [Halteria grandinella]|uniref:Uncharacterized protein n=1 Tax=Halteria grandinella TaxID=5974 RepID=A0A8J8NZI8_HALGN|nr:hypothetical protein FGO68_gene7647 [Halteria grandinella]